MKNLSITQRMKESMKGAFKEAMKKNLKKNISTMQNLFNKNLSRNLMKKNLKKNLLKKNLKKNLFRNLLLKNYLVAKFFRLNIHSYCGKGIQECLLNQFLLRLLSLWKSKLTNKSKN